MSTITTTWTQQQHHQPAFDEGKDATTALDHERRCTACGDSLPHDLAVDDPCSVNGPLHPYTVTISEGIEYYVRNVEAASPEQAMEIVAERMINPTWEDPRHCDVQGQAVTRAERED